MTSFKLKTKEYVDSRSIDSLYVETKRTTNEMPIITKLLDNEKRNENKILELNNKIFKISVISIFAIVLLLTALILYYTSAYDEGYKNGAKDTQRLYESITNQK